MQMVKLEFVGFFLYIFLFILLIVDVIVLSMLFFSQACGHDST